MGSQRQARREKAARTGMADALFSRVQQRLLGLLFGQPDRSFQSAEIIRLAGSGTGAAYRVLARLADAGWITVSRVGNQKFYRANRDSPAFGELHGLIVKTVGVVEPLRSALKPLASRVRAAFVYGSVAKGSDRAGSDLDLMVLADHLPYPELFESLQKAQAILARPVNPTLMTHAEFRAKRDQPDSFAARVAAQPKLFVIGGENDLALSSTTSPASSGSSASGCRRTSSGSRRSGATHLTDGGRTDVAAIHRTIPQAKTDPIPTPTR